MSGQQPHSPSGASDEIVDTFGVLHITTADGELSPIELRYNPFVVGRNHTSHQVIQNPCISAVHGVFTFQAQNTQSQTMHLPRVVTFADTSTNGCFVNEMKLGKGQARSLSDGDVIHFVKALKPEHAKYNVKAVYRAGPPPEPTPPRPTMEETQRADPPPTPEPMSAVIRDDVSVDYDMDLNRCLGSGSFATVYYARRRSTGQPVAVKQINKKRLSFPEASVDEDAAKVEEMRKEKEKYERDMERQRREVEILLSVRHDHVVRCEGVYETDSHLWFVMDFAAGGELYHFLKDLQVIPIAVVRRAVLQCTEALQYLHSVGVVHRDIKLENLLLANEVPAAKTLTAEAIADLVEVKVSDFGLSRVLDTNSAIMSTMCGTPIYVAPEVVDVRLRKDRGGYSPEVDAFSLGVVAYALMTGRPPFPYMVDEQGRQLKNRIDYGKPLRWPPAPRGIGPTWPAEAKDFVTRLLAIKPTERMTISEALMHPFLLADAKATRAKKRPRDDDDDAQ